MADDIYIQSDGKELGPASAGEVRSLIAGGLITETDLARCEGETEWRPIGTLLAGLQTKHSAAPPPPVVMAPPIPPAPLPAASVVAPARPAAPRARPIGFYAAIGGAILVVAAISYPIANFLLERMNQTPRVQSPPPAKPAAVPGAPRRGGNPGRALASATTTRGTAGPVQARVTAPTNGVAEAAAPPAVKPDTTVTNSPAEEASPIPGGARGRTVTSKLDAKSAPFGAYDIAMISAVQKRWFELLDKNDVVRGRSGTIIVGFRLNASGMISDLKVQANAADGVLAYLCEAAVRDTAPYPRWPSELIRSANSSTREVQFTFTY